MMSLLATSYIKLKNIENENKWLRNEINKSNKRKIEASYFAARLAEANHYLYNSFCEVRHEIEAMEKENERLIMKLCE